MALGKRLINTGGISVPEGVWDFGLMNWNSYELISGWDYSSGGTTGHFWQDGTSFYRSAYNTVNSRWEIEQWALSTPDDLTSRSLVRRTYMGSQQTYPMGHYFSSDGTRFWTGGRQNNTVTEWSLSTAWNLDTASFVKSINATGDINNFTWSPDGVNFVIQDWYRCRYFRASTPFDINTLSLITSFNTAGNSQYSAWYSPDGSKYFTDWMYFYLGNDQGTPKVYQYNMSGTPFYLNEGRTTSSYNVNIPPRDDANGGEQGGGSLWDYYGVNFYIFSPYYKYYVKFSPL